MANPLLEAVKSYDKSKLKQTDTKITTTGGLQLIEKRDESGNVTHELTGSCKADGPTYGFVPSFVDDLQVGEIIPGRLLIGSQDVAHNWELLEQHKVTHILNLATYVKNAFPDKIKYLELKINDLPEVHILAIFNRAFAFIDEAIKTGCVLVHCNAGVSRAATVCIGYMMKSHEMSYKDAFDLVKEKRPAICPNAGFRVQLETYDERLKSERSSKDK